MNLDMPLSLFCGFNDFEHKDNARSFAGQNICRSISVRLSIGGLAAVFLIEFIMVIRIRQEQNEDCLAVSDLIEAAFADMQQSDHQEHLLVKRLHGSDTFVPQLSLVAETDDERIVGYILLTKVEIVSETCAETSLAVAPLAVLPGFQKRGIGGMLLMEAHKRAASLGFGTAVVLGHKEYYPRFGYRKAIDFGIEFPFDVPHELCMIAELIPHAADGLSGMVRYPDVFGIG